MDIKAILEALKCRDEELEFLGHKVIVRELGAEVALVTPADAAGVFEKDPDLATWRIFVRGVFYAETGLPVFSDDDIPELRKGSRWKLAELNAAVNRVNGFDSKANEKNSPAVQA